MLRQTTDLWGTFSESLCWKSSRHPTTIFQIPATHFLRGPACYSFPVQTRHLADHHPAVSANTHQAATEPGSGDTEWDVPCALPLQDYSVRRRGLWKFSLKYRCKCFRKRIEFLQNNCRRSSHFPWRPQERTSQNKRKGSLAEWAGLQQKPRETPNALPRLEN